MVKGRKIEDGELSYRLQPVSVMAKCIMFLLDVFLSIFLAFVQVVKLSIAVNSEKTNQVNLLNWDFFFWMEITIGESRQVISIKRSLDFPGLKGRFF